MNKSLHNKLLLMTKNIKLKNWKNKLKSLNKNKVRANYFATFGVIQQ